MTDYTLKFKDEAEATEVLTDYAGSIDVIGIIRKRAGGTDEEPVMTAVPGWHVNVRGPELLKLNAYVVQVATPERVWA